MQSGDSTRQGSVYLCAIPLRLTGCTVDPACDVLDAVYEGMSVGAEEEESHTTHFFVLRPAMEMRELLVM